MGTILLTQNLATSTLIAGKSTALRLFVPSAQDASEMDSVEVTILWPDGSRVTLQKAPDLAVPHSNFDFVGPSIVVIVPGRLLPWVGTYYFRARTSRAGQVVSEYIVDRVKLLRTKDLRVMVVRVWPGGTGQAQPGELDAARRAMQRLGALYPVRDGISTLDGVRNAGLRYNLDDNPEGPPNQDGNLCPLFQQWLNRPANVDSIDAAIAFRFTNAGDHYQVGGSSGHYCLNSSFQWSLLVWEGFMANVFCQETCHCFGLEPAQDPHLDPGHQHAHALDPLLEPLKAGLGFNVGEIKELPNPAYDLMHWIQLAPDDNSIALNSWDWEFLRQQLVKLPSTGPTGPFLSWRNLEGHDLRPALAVGKNADGRQIAFLLGGDRALYYRQQGQLEGWWDDWASLHGHDLQAPVRVATGADGRVYVFVLGGDGKIYSRCQAGPNGAWGGWVTIGGEHVKGDFAVARNSDGHLQIVAVWADGSLHDTAQGSADGPWGSWNNLGGRQLSGSIALTANADGRLAAFAVGGDGLIYYQWQLQPNGAGGWSGWSTLNDPNDEDFPTSKWPRSERVAAIPGGDGRIYVFLMKTDHRLSVQVQNKRNASGTDWTRPTDLTGPLLDEPSALWPCVVALNPDGRIEVFMVGQNRQVYNQWQVDPDRPDVWSDWVTLGGRDLQPALGVGKDERNEIDYL